MEMVNADLQYLELVDKIMKHGHYHKTRAVALDGKPSYAYKVFGHTFNFDLRVELPILTIKKTFEKSAREELFWIWVRGSNNIKDLNSNIWNEWADKNGSIGKAYGYQARNLKVAKFDWLPKCLAWKNIDQVQNLIDGLKKDPYGRRHIVTFWNVSDLPKMNLQPCAFQTIWDVEGEYLNCNLIQRSGDVGLGVPFNFYQYAVLVHMVAHVVGLKAGKLKHDIANAHIYENHMEPLKQIFGREPYEPPRIYVDQDVKDFNKYKMKDIFLIDYKSHPHIPLEVSV